MCKEFNMFADKKKKVDKNVIKFSTFINVPIVCLKLLGLFTLMDHNTHPTKMQKFFNIISTMYYALVSLNLLIAFGGMLTVALSNSDDLMIFTTILSTCIVELLLFSKSISIWYNQAEFRYILTMLQELFPKTFGKQQKYNVENYAKKFVTFKVLFLVTSFIMGLVYGFAPLITNIFTGVWVYRLPFEIWLPINVLHPENYYYVYGWQIWLEHISEILMIGFGLLVCGIITLLTMEFDFLQQDLKDFKETFIVHDFKRLKLLIDRQNTLIMLSNKLHIILSPVILINLMFNTVAIGMGGFMLTTDAEMWNIIKFGLYLNTCIIECGMFCFFGNKLIDSSAGVGDGAYNCEWYNMKDSRIKKGLQLIIIRSQTPCELTAMNFTKLSLETFYKVRMVVSVEFRTSNVLVLLFRFWRDHTTTSFS